MDTPVRTALAAFGRSGRIFHAPLLEQNPLFTIHAVLERSNILSRTFFPECKIYRDYDQLLQDNDIELVIVNTPDSLHFDMTLRALRAGKHVVVEKPFTQSYKDAEILILEAEKRGLVLTVFQNRRFDADFLTVRNIVKSGVLGKIVECSARMDKYVPEISLAWRETDNGTNSSLFNLGSHIIDQMQNLFGKPDAVTAVLKNLRPESAVKDYCDLTLHYPELVIKVMSSYVALEPSHRFYINGTFGSFISYQPGLQQQGAWGDEECTGQNFYLALASRHDQNRMREQVTPEKNNHRKFYEQVWGAVRGIGSPPVLPEEALLTMQILEKAFQSSAEKRTISII